MGAYPPPPGIGAYLQAVGAGAYLQAAGIDAYLQAAGVGACPQLPGAGPYLPPPSVGAYLPAPASQDFTHISAFLQRWLPQHAAPHVQRLHLRLDPLTVPTHGWGIQVALPGAVPDGHGLALMLAAALAACTALTELSLAVQPGPLIFLLPASTLSQRLRSLRLEVEQPHPYNPTPSGGLAVGQLGPLTALCSLSLVGARLQLTSASLGPPSAAAGGAAPYWGGPAGPAPLPPSLTSLELANFQASSGSPRRFVHAEVIAAAPPWHLARTNANLVMLVVEPAPQWAPCQSLWC
jgi:hypothetical protein